MTDQELAADAAWKAADAAWRAKAAAKEALEAAVGEPARKVAVEALAALEEALDAALEEALDAAWKAKDEGDAA